MKLTKEDFALLCSKDKSAFLVKAYLSYDPSPSVRECTEATGLKFSTCYRLMRRLGWQGETANGTPIETAKPRATKAKTARVETPIGTAVGTPIEAVPAPREAPSLSPLKEAFDHYYHSLLGAEYYWSAKDMVALRGIRTKLLKGMRDKGIAPTDEGVLESFRLLLGIIEDKWILEHLSPSIINSKYNDIRTKYIARQTGRSTDRGGGTSYEAIRNAIKSNYGID